ncbi:MAG: 2OG-Fe(II) oxygenase [Hyphomicrobiaceae bacterium]|nr:2OG-Fe(II) oxygenase [Hyphomicrobiaceae bacterium]
MAFTSQAFIDNMRTSMAASTRREAPYRHWLLTGCLPDDAIAEVTDLPFPAPALGGVSGKRELHNATRTYFDAGNMDRFPVCRAFNEAFQSAALTRDIASFFGTSLDGTYLRVEYAQDTNGFWLEPHTDLGVKVFTMLLYVSTDPSHHDLGTDIYDNDKAHVGRSPFASNAALVFVPSNNTYHGFEPRQIDGIRKSIIINYVTNEWRAREQLAFPQSPIGQ